MPTQTQTTPPLRVTVLAALWVSLGRCGVSQSPALGCDNGKLSLERDLPDAAAGGAAFNWDCPMSAWPQSTQRRQSVDTVYEHPVPARQICMDKSISYNHTIPNSGSYRPVRAESGEYLYCPPQRWLNNLHHGATVLLYHPCAPLPERALLSALARSCLSQYIMSPHPRLSQHTPIALVSWGHTLELSTVASPELCDWLETTTSTTNKSSGTSQSRKYNLLLTWPAQRHRQSHAPAEENSETTQQESVRRCCEQTISSNRAMGAELQSDMKKKKKQKKSLKQEEGKSRRIRAAILDRRGNVTDEGAHTVTHLSSLLLNSTDTQNVQKYNGTLDSPPPLNMPLSNPLLPQEVPPLSKILNINPGLTPGPTTPLGSHISDKTSADSLGFNATAGSQKGQLTLQTAALALAQQPRQVNTTDMRRNPEPSAGSHVLLDESGGKRTTRPKALLSHSIKHEATDPTKQRNKDSVDDGVRENASKAKHSTAGGGGLKMKDEAVVEVKERELEHKQTHGGAHSHHKGRKPGVDPVSKPKADGQPDPQPASYLPTIDPGAEALATDVNAGSMLRTPRSDEAVWAAAALGFLLVLLTLSVLHTRLYRHWTTTPSMYWHDPHRDYDSVADVIRRRLRISDRRRKRGRRQECVLLPSSSSSDEEI